MADCNFSAGVDDIECGLGLLASLVTVLRMDDSKMAPAVLALAQKAGALIERGAVSSGLMDWEFINGDVESWMGISRDSKQTATSKLEVAE